MSLESEEEDQDDDGDGDGRGWPGKSNKWVAGSGQSTCRLSSHLKRFDLIGHDSSSCT